MAKKILFINQEISPYVPESEMSTMGRLAPQRVFEKGFEIRTFMPKWGNINERRGQLHEVIRLSGMNLIINETDHPLIIKVASMPSCRTQVYFIDNDDYFTKRQMGVDDKGVPYTDNGERAIFFARRVLETVKKLRWIPDVIHCQGWMSAIVPLYIKTAYKDEPSFSNVKVVTSLYNNELDKDFGPDLRHFIEFRDANAEVLSVYPEVLDFNSLSKIAIDFSDGVIEAGTKVDPELVNYAESKGVPVLKYPGEDYKPAYKEFFDSICGEE